VARDTLSSFLKAIQRGELYDKIKTTKNRGLEAQDPAARGE